VNTTQKRLLFVDDEEAIRITLAAILRRYGLSVTVSSSVAEALHEIKNQNFDLLLCDLNIGEERDGLDVARVMRGVNPDCVTIILTGYPDMESVAEAKRLGIDDYISKPYKPDMLVALLAEKLAARERLSVAQS
jgi:two-component system, NtrC family, response regulator HydG